MILNLLNFSSHTTIPSHLKGIALGTMVKQKLKHIFEDTICSFERLLSKAHKTIFAYD